MAKNGAGYGKESAHSAPFKPTRLTDTVTIATARKPDDFRVTGTASAVGATVTIRVGSPTGTSLGTALVTQAVAPATGGEYDFRLRKGASPTTNPTTIYVVSSGGGVAGPFRVAAG